MTKKIASIPSARRLITSLRDIGYGFIDAVAEIVDNSIQAKSNFIQIKLVFAGRDSYLLVLDNGKGMSPVEIREAMRFGSGRNYSEEDLGRFGLGLKTASLSQCDELIVSSRQGKERARINSYIWSMDHVESSDKWEASAISQPK
jgi:DNA topoisomerase VI subunit B